MYITNDQRRRAARARLHRLMRLTQGWWAPVGAVLISSVLLMTVGPGNIVDFVTSWMGDRPHEWAATNPDPAAVVGSVAIAVLIYLAIIGFNRIASRSQRH